MPNPTWMIYGAYGYTGTLVAEEAVRRGHQPILAGRSQRKLANLAERVGLDHIVVLDLEDTEILAEAVADVDLVYHAAGPFIHTSAPMIHACLAGHTHYLDITAEISVFEDTFSHDQAARDAGVALISGVGFDVVPTDCLAKHVADQVPDAVELEVAIATGTHASAGTTKTMLESLPEGGMVRRNGELISFPLGAGVKQVQFSNGTRTVVVIPWGDVATAYRTTSIPNITTYMAVPPFAAGMARALAPLAQRLLAIDPLQDFAQSIAEKTVQGPDSEMRRTGRSYVWARAGDGRGNEAQAWLETPETYRFTAVAGVRAVERVLADQPSGALTPAQALGADFVLEIEDTQRFDALPA